MFLCTEIHTVQVLISNKAEIEAHAFCLLERSDLLCVMLKLVCELTHPHFFWGNWRAMPMDLVNISAENLRSFEGEPCRIQAFTD